MVTLQDLREYMRERASEDRVRRSVQVTAASIEEALGEASLELGLPVKRLEYELLEKGNRGVFGMNKKDWILIVYEADEEEGAREEGEDLGIDFDLLGATDQADQDADGAAVVRLTPDGAMLRVTPPIGRGKKVQHRVAVEMLERRGVERYDDDLVASVVKRADGEFVRVGDFSYNPANDSVLAVELSDHEMRAFLKIHRPGSGGIDQSAESITTFLKNNGVIHGIKEEVIRGLESSPVYDEKIPVAEGEQPKDGADAKILYNFDYDRSNIKLKEKNGRVDFKEMNLIQNVVEGQVLAKKVPAEKGTSGRTITGKLIPAKDGRDISIGVGKNVELEEDEMSARATINGQVILTADKINVEPIYVVQGDVNLKSGGNVIFLGTVYVKGSVDDGFKVKASGNIEVLGNVGKAELDAEGDIIVHQGIAGKTGGRIQSGKSVWAKFIENARVEAGEFVVASDGIINTHVIANKKVVCQGKRATIVGGSLKAAEEIHAKTLGSVAGSETILEVGYDPRTKEKLARLEERIQGFDANLEEINLNVRTLENFKKAKKELPEDKAAFLEELLAKREETAIEKEQLLEEVRKIQEYLSSLKIRGRVSASSKVFPGVRIFIKDAFLEVRNEFNAVTFINEANVVKITQYEELDEELSRKR